MDSFDFCGCVVTVIVVIGMVIDGVRSDLNRRKRLFAAKTLLRTSLYLSGESYNRQVDADRTVR